MSAPKPRRECFVTIGATASFRLLLSAVLTTSFLSTLSELEYTHLTLQCGPDLSYADTKIKDEGLDWEGRGIKVRSFDFNKEGLGHEMRGCKGKGRSEREGVVVCHAGE
jgi:beta-1,4-N-acetylglucosaminyltransferase